MRKPVRVLLLPALLCALALLAAGAAPAGAATTTFRAVADTYVSATAPTTNFGTATRLKTDGDPLHRGYLRFDVRGLTGPVVRATLRLRSHTDAESGIAVRPVTGPWVEASTVHATAPALGPLLSQSGPIEAGRWALLDVTKLVREGPVSLGITSMNTNIKWFSSREATGEVPELFVVTEDPPPPAGSDPVIAAAGDIACDPGDSDFHAGAGSASYCRQMAVSDLLLGQGLAAVLPLGDLQYHDGALSSFGASYDPSWGRVKSITRPAVGNHEYMQAGAAGYFDYFNGTAQSAGPAGARGHGYYSYDVGAWHLVALNSNCAQVGGCGPGSPQEQWLRSDLAAHPSACVLAYWHHPRFTSGTHGPDLETAPLFSALYAAGADVLLSGHEHNYERFARQSPSGAPDVARGIRQFVVGTGGRSNYGFPSTIARNSGMRDSDTYGVLRLRLAAKSYEWRFVAADGATFADSGTDTCEGRTVDTQSPSAPTEVTARADEPRTVNLSWRASTDNDGISRYRIARNGAFLGYSTGTTYRDTTVTAGSTYRYHVRALDASGNWSAASTPVSATALGGERFFFPPTDDATVQQAFPTTTYGAGTLLEVDADPVRDVLLRFDVTGLGGRTPRSARLELYATDGGGQGGSFTSTVAADWTQGTLNWLNAPAAGTAVASLGEVSAGRWYSVDVSAVVRGEGVVSLRASSSSADAARYGSAEGASEFAPRLVVLTD